MTIVDRVFGDYTNYHLIQYSIYPNENCTVATLKVNFSICEAFEVQLSPLSESGEKQIEFAVKTGSSDHFNFVRKTHITVLYKKGYIIADGKLVGKCPCVPAIDRRTEYDRLSTTFVIEDGCAYKIYIDPYYGMAYAPMLQRLTADNSSSDDDKIKVRVVKTNWNFYALNILAKVIGIFIGTILFAIFCVCGCQTLGREKAVSKSVCQRKRTKRNQEQIGSKEPGKVTSLEPSSSDNTSDQLKDKKGKTIDTFAKETKDSKASTVK
ncbi:unnamed protein product [Bursaphelenchus okinawaensis]|uniref:Uncharacterized protein n=1 Tax=Bursaphelenchus okinawaensis TaxID=465554 RepID=A0A811JQV9_9BILA|nr:unnamed protein product [Bursaphelenchus okinawaensis]CAG9078484.1 unnamed protein product [Bursaphelenchus okinawaensis]